MSRTPYKGVEEARGKLPELLDQARDGQATVITRHGRAVAALVPLESYSGLAEQRPLLALQGTGRGLWGRQSSRTLRKLRSEWSR
ncbi:MAG TPA: type II toxin-antitoxin system prevent-host-death family antitoxin [Steroidobacteraceae bacterium]|nr:type II toxin-antitoxin system prevent-host-death family antitoxin [Steroidobacteraceae bacterium]